MKCHAASFCLLNTPPSTEAFNQIDKIVTKIEHQNGTTHTKEHGDKWTYHGLRAADQRVSNTQLLNTMCLGTTLPYIRCVYLVLQRAARPRIADMYLSTYVNITYFHGKSSRARSQVSIWWPSGSQEVAKRYLEIHLIPM